MDPKDDKNKKPGDKKNNGFNIFNLLIIGLFITIFINMSFFSNANGTQVEISFNSFLDLVEGDYIESVRIKSDRYLITLKDDVDEEAVKTIITLRSTEDLILETEEGQNAEASDDTSAVQTQQAGDNADPAIDKTIISNNSILSIMQSNAEDQKISYFTGRIDEYPGLGEIMREKDIEFLAPVTDTNWIYDLFFSYVLPIGFFYLMITLITRNMSKRMGGSGGGFMNIGKTNAKLYNMEKKTGITFNDVAGQEEAKESLLEIVDYLHHPEKYLAIGAKQPKGALLVGPPGTGKTLLAKAVAGEAKVPFFSLTGSEFVEMYVGVGASRVRDLFKIANQNAPCIIFIDEIDAIGKSRDNQLGSNDEREQTLNQLLSEMDGFDTAKGIVILAATNRPEILDKALLRPGRFDRRVIVEKPDLIGREAILAVHAKKVLLDNDVNLKQIALATSGASGADLANMINEAALSAVRLGRKKVTQADLMESVEVVIAGKEKKDRILSKKEKRLVAYHEVGHALTAALQKNTMPVQKITIVPRTMGALGYIMQMPEEDKFLMTKEEFLAEIVTLLGGRAAEKVIFNTSTTGASNDIERATKMARGMVSQYGMSEKFGVMGLESIESRYLDGRPVTTCASETEAARDKEVMEILDSCYKQAVGLLENNVDIVHKIAEFLLEKESITGEEFMNILKENKEDFVEEVNEETERRLTK